jgi:hypothetical protein
VPAVIGHELLRQAGWKAGLASCRLAGHKEMRFDDRYYGTSSVVRQERR